MVRVRRLRLLVGGGGGFDVDDGAEDFLIRVQESTPEPQTGTTDSASGSVPVLDPLPIPIIERTVAGSRVLGRNVEYLVEAASADVAWSV